MPIKGEDNTLGAAVVGIAASKVLAEASVSLTQVLLAPLNSLIHTCACFETKSGGRLLSGRTMAPATYLRRCERPRRSIRWSRNRLRAPSRRPRRPRPLSMVPVALLLATAPSAMSSTRSATVRSTGIIASRGRRLLASRSTMTPCRRRIASGCSATAWLRRSISSSWTTMKPC
jgi:hypothetical protein